MQFATFLIREPVLLALAVIVARVTLAATDRLRTFLSLLTLGLHPRAKTGSPVSSLRGKRCNEYRNNHHQKQPFHIPPKSAPASPSEVGILELFPFDVRPASTARSTNCRNACPGHHASELEAIQNAW